MHAAYIYRQNKTAERCIYCSINLAPQCAIIKDGKYTVLKSLGWYGCSWTLFLLSCVTHLQLFIILGTLCGLSKWTRLQSIITEFTSFTPLNNTYTCRDQGTRPMFKLTGVKLINLYCIWKTETSFWTYFRETLLHCLQEKQYFVRQLAYGTKLT